MIKMLLIAPYQEFADQFLQVFQEHTKIQRKRDIDLDDYTLHTVVASWPSEIKNLDLDFEVIVSRGFVSEELQRMDRFIPVVEVPVAAGDLVQSLKRAKNEFQAKRVAVLGSLNMVMGVEKYEDVFGLQVQQVILNTTEEIRSAVEGVVKSGTDTVIGGVKTCAFAEELGVPHVLLESGKESMWHSITEAKRLAHVSRRVEEQSENLKVILNKSFEGIIAVDASQRITVFNQAASRILSVSAIQVLGRSVDEVLPALKGVYIAETEEGMIPELIQYEKKQLSVRGTSIRLRGESIGRIYTLQEVSKIQELETRIREKIYLRGHVAKHTFEDIIGSSAAILSAIHTAKRYSLVDSNILILGKTGTGKELFAQSIHTYSPRKNGPFVAVNCAALPETLLESELFGYVEGAFTGASKGGKPGLFELAHQGTLFLDEISEIPPRLQGRLLRAIQEKEIMRLGHDRVIPVDVRIIAASNKNLIDMVRAGAFREDLYYRIDILTLELPELAERREDIPAIAEYWIHQFTHQFGLSPIQITEKAKRRLRTLDLPGNIRQLRNFCERLVVLSQCQVIDERDVEAVVAAYTSPVSRKPSVQVMGNHATINFKKEVRDFEKERLLTALKNAAYNKNLAAKALGISRTTLWRRMRELELI
ncbi:MAG TPA: sigma 54-interacting transcriptional regulator [Spirochaetales bacterium]|nr:sigma 54-interacting transcriptional regulator [Spirochaetales bacterium]HOV38244.1 sigma 54-interacting transcriptional regulator [Spirochaetales bacterium]